MKDYSFVSIPIINVYFHHDFINGGHKGPFSFLEPGYVFAPYIPMMDLETEFQPRQGLASRYATRLVNEDFYGTITVNGLYNGVQLPRVNKTFS